MNKWGLPSAALPARHREPPRPPSAAPQAMPGGLRRGGRVKGWPSRQGGMASPLNALHMKASDSYKIQVLIN